MTRRLRNIVISNLRSGPLTRREIAERLGLPLAVVKHMAAVEWGRPKQRGIRRDRQALLVVCAMGAVLTLLSMLADFSQAYSSLVAPR